MTTTVGNLLDLLHEQAWLMAGNPTTHTPTTVEEGASIRHAWERLARYTCHVLRALPYAPEGRTASHASIIADTLEPLRSHPTSDVTPEPGLMKMSVLLGGIADLVTSPPAQPWPVDDAAAEGLLTSVLAAVHCAARWSIPRLDAVEGRRFATLAGRLRQVMVATELFAAVPPGQRGSNLEDLAITSPVAPGLDGALVRWRHAAVDLLASRYRPTSTAFQTLASDQATLMAAATAVLRAVPPDAHANPVVLPQAVSGLRSAHSAWTGLTTWPADVTLGGARSRELRAASSDLRAELRSLLRTGDRWATTGELEQRIPSADLLALVRRSLRWASEVAAAHTVGLVEQVLGVGRPWMKGESVPDELRGPMAHRAVARGGWVPAPIGHTTGSHVQLVRDTVAAREATTIARDTVQAANLPATPPHGVITLTVERERVFAATVGQEVVPSRTTGRRDREATVIGHRLAPAPHV